ncbi:MAG: ribosome maturation factor RimM [Terriglobia bacterium]
MLPFDPGLCYVLESRPRGRNLKNRGCDAVDSGNNEWFAAIARVVKPQGRRGEVTAEILTDFPGRFQALKEAFLENPGSGPRPVRIESAWPHKGRVVLKFSGVESIDQAEGLRGLHVLIPKSQRAPLPSSSYYISELIGCRVVTCEDGRERDIGTVTGVEGTGGSQRLEVERLGPGGGELLIPLVQEICTRIDTAARVIVIDPPQDLLDLNRP